MRPTYTDTVQGRGRPVQHPPALHPAQQRVTDWEQEVAEEARQLPAVRPAPSYVPNLAERIQMPQVGIASPDANLVAEVTPAAVIEGKTLGSHADRARAWLKYALPLCGSFALAMTIAAIALYDVPVLSFATGLTFFLSFIVAYSLLLARYWQHTPEGVALKHTDNLWGYFKREQKHRHAIEAQAWQDQRALAKREDRRVR